MSIPLLIGLVLLGVLVVAAAGVWHARTQSAGNAQSSVMVLLIVAAVAALVFYLFRGRF